MGYSHVCYGDRCTHENDEDLTVLRHFIEREGVQLLAEWGNPQPLATDFQKFLNGFFHAGPGVFLADFDALLGSSGQRVKCLLEILVAFTKHWRDLATASRSSMLFQTSIPVAPSSSSAM